MFKMFTWKKFFFISIIVFLVACGTNDNNGSGDTDRESLENYPEKSIEYLVGFGPGGTVDMAARTLAQILNSEEIITESIMVNNMPGGGSALALQELNKRKGDSHLVLGSYTVGDPVWKDAGMSLEDFKPIASIIASEVLIAVKSDSPYQTIDELLDEIKSNPDNIRLGIPGGVDGIDAFYWDQIIKEYGIEKANYVTADGGAEDFNNLLGGHIDAAFVVPSVGSDYIETGEIRPLVVLSDTESLDYPDVPTLKDVGLDVTYTRTYGLWTGGEVSDQIVDFWYDSLREATDTAEWEEFINSNQLIPYLHGPTDYNEYIETEGKKYSEYLESLDN